MEIKQRISILSKISTINYLDGITFHACDISYAFLIDYVNWQYAYTCNYTDAFIEELIKKDEKNLMNYITYARTNISFIEKYMNSEYMDIKRLIDSQCLIFTPEFIDKYISHEHIEYYKESLYYSTELEHAIASL